jgi:hypothetical protein
MNTIKLVQLATTMSGPRHGGPVKERRHKLYINDKLYRSYTEGSQATGYASKEYYDRYLDNIIEDFERVLDCKTERIDASHPTPVVDVRTDEQKNCQHDFRPTNNWLIDVCAKCGVEQA